MEYQVEMVYEQSDLIAFTQAFMFQKKPVRALRTFSRIILWIVGGFFILMGVIGLWHSISGFIVGADYSTLPIMSILFILLGLFIVWRSSNKSKLMGKLSWKNYNEKGTKIIYSFYPECFTETLPNSDHRLEYSVIKSIFQDAERYYLFISPQVAHIIKKSDFNVGDSSQFGLFIAERTQLPIDIVSN